MVSKHYETKRGKREKFIEEHLGEGHMIDGFIVDKGHPKGAEVHSILDNGLIIVHNLNSGKLVTKLLAREWQIRRYYENTNRQRPPEYDEVVELARQHEKLGYNYM